MFTLWMRRRSLGRKRDGVNGAVSAARAWAHRSAQAKRKIQPQPYRAIVGV
jgi:hypothetical protein